MAMFNNTVRKPFIIADTNALTDRREGGHCPTCPLEGGFCPRVILYRGDFVREGIMSRGDFVRFP